MLKIALNIQVKDFVLYLALAVILFEGAEMFSVGAG